jgi:DNA-binding MarR family transcriptional regulator
MARTASRFTRRAEEGVPLAEPTRRDFENLLAFRVSLRRFQHWSEQQAGAAGLTHVQHQLLVAIKGHAGDVPPTVSEVAGYLMLRHHSAVELIHRAAAAGLVRRRPDPRDGRVARVELTKEGDRLVTDLTHAHLVELHKLAAVLNRLVTEDYLMQGGADGPTRRLWRPADPRAPAAERILPARTRL